MPVPDPVFAIDDFVELTNVNYYDGQLGLMISHWRITNITGAVPLTMENVADGFDTVMGPPTRALMAAAASHRGCRMRRVSPDVSAYVDGITEQGAGDIAGSAMPTQVSGIITLKTVLPGRANRGRKYVPFPSEASNTVNNRPEALYLTDLTTLAIIHVTDLTCTFAGVNTITFTPVIYRSGAPLMSTVLTSFRANEKWATQRRRGIFGKPNATLF